MQDSDCPSLGALPELRVFTLRHSLSRYDNRNSDTSVGWRDLLPVAGEGFRGGRGRKGETARRGEDP